MSTMKYEVIGELNAPDDFNTAVLGTLQKRSMLPITARRTDVDDLAAKRGDSDIIEFDLLVRATHIVDDTFVIGGYMHKNGKKGSYISIEVTDRVRFDVISS